MTFATVSDNRQQLSLLSRLLTTAFPGSTVHQSRDPMRTAQRLSAHKVDAVFADADVYSHLLHTLSGKNANTQIYLLCRQDSLPREKAEGIYGVVTYPITEQKIRVALQVVSQESGETV